MRRALLPHAIAFVPGFVVALLLLATAADSLGPLPRAAVLWDAPRPLVLPTQVVVLAALATAGALLAVRPAPPPGRGRRGALAAAALAGAVAAALVFFGLAAVWDALDAVLRRRDPALLVRLRDPLFYTFPVLAGLVSQRLCHLAVPQPGVRPTDVSLQLTERPDHLREETARAGRSTGELGR